MIKHLSKTIMSLRGVHPTWQSGFPKLTKKSLIPIITLTLLITLIPLIFFFLSKSASAAWDANHGQWLKRKQLTLVNNSGSTINTSVPYQITVDTKSLFSTSRGDLQADCDDLRIVYQLNGTASGTELVRAVQYASGATNCQDSSATTATGAIRYSGGRSAEVVEDYII